MAANQFEKSVLIPLSNVRVNIQVREYFSQLQEGWEKLVRRINY